jgi:hypothetical protein
LSMFVKTLGKIRETLHSDLVLAIIHIERNQHMRERPVGVTILAILAGVAAVLAAIHALQFLVIVTIFELILDFISLLGKSSWQDVSVSFIVCLIILLYCMLPDVRRAFGTAAS